MTLEYLFEDKSIKAKAKAKQIGEWLVAGELPIEEWLAFANSQIGSNRATCIESLEYATKSIPELVDPSVLSFVIANLKEDEPRIKWESAKVIGNVAKRFPDHLKDSVENLLLNATHDGTVVRWATAYALAEILKLKTDLNTDLLPQLELLAEKEEDTGVRKKYMDAFMKVKK